MKKRVIEFSDIDDMEELLEESGRWNRQLIAENETLRARIAELEAALQLLCDLQNGPPLIRDSDAWHNAMTKARALLSKGQPE